MCMKRNGKYDVLVVTPTCEPLQQKYVGAPPLSFFFPFKLFDNKPSLLIFMSLPVSLTSSVSMQLHSKTLQTSD